MPGDAQLSKSEAGYMRVGITGAKCGNCKWFRRKSLTSGSCELVGGEISSVFCCNGWESENGPRNSYDFSDGSVFDPAIAAAEEKQLKSE